MRGKFKEIFKHKKNKLKVLDVASVGDYIEYNLNDDGTGVINEIFERNNFLSRKAPKIKGALQRGERYEQIIVSNVDRIFIVCSIIQPEFNNKFVDRMIVAAESNNILPSIIINKTDLSENKIKKWQDLYEGIGYKVYLSSAVTMKGIEEIRNDTKKITSVFWGYSGVGKSSLINAMYPEFNLKTGEISEYTNKGTHTTVTAKLINIDNNTFIADTPGIKEIDPYGLRKEDLSHYFAEFKEHLPFCRFNTCTHLHEPGCGVINAVQNGKISSERYESYLNIVNSIEDDMCFQVKTR